MGIGNRLHTCSREHLNQPQRQTIRRDLTLSHAKPNRLAQPVQRLLRKGSFELTCHRANVFALHPKPPDRLVVLLIKRSDRVEHFKFPLFFNKFKDPTYEDIQDFEIHRGDHEEVDGDQVSEMVGQERFPGRGR